MTIVDAIVLGLVQGFTEFLPVSSSGHLVIAQTLLHVPAPGILLEVSLHVATLLSVTIVYRKRLAWIVTGALRGEKPAWGYVALLVLATLPAVAVGLGLEGPIEAAFDAPAIAGVMLLLTGGILWSTRNLRDGTVERPSARLALAIGVAQAFAILPGISRSGTTITAGLWGRMDGEKAAEFSFLMSIPAIAGAAVLQLLELDGGMNGIAGTPLAIAFAVALLSGIAAIRSLVWLVQRRRFHVFAYYLWPAGALFLAYLALT